MGGRQVRGTEYGLAKDSKGMSLVEIIIAVAILSLLIGIAGYGLSLSSGKPAEKCAQKLASVIQQARTATMGKNTTIVTIKMDSSKGVVVEQEVTTVGADGKLEPQPKTEEVVGSNDVNIEFRLNGTDDSTLVSELKLEFNRANGALRNVNDADASSYMPTIKISKGNTTRLIEIFPLTGKLSVGAMP